MRITFYIYTALIGLVTSFSSCVSQGDYKELRSMYDSVSMLNVAYQDQAYQTDSLVASIISSFQDLSMVEGMINVNTLRGEIPTSEQTRIRRNIRLLSDKLEQSNNSIELLIKRIESNEAGAARMQGTIAMLRSQLSQQKERILTVAEETIKKIEHVNGLDDTANRLKAEAERLRKLNLEEQMRLQDIENSLNVVHYAMGTKDDLRYMGLLNKDYKISIDNADLNYLTKADRRELKSINLQSKTGKLLSLHPKNSYKIKADDKGYLSLEILDSIGFWRYTHLMLAEVDY